MYFFNFLLENEAGQANYNENKKILNPAAIFALGLLYAVEYRVWARLTRRLVTNLN